MKALLIDNEPQLRQGLKLLLESFCPEVKMIAESDGVISGLEAIKNFKPDLVFLDVEMDDGTGFDLMKQVIDPHFQLIFVTAHNKYAIDAFHFCAIDYLLKPVDPEALQISVEKAITQIQNKDLKKQIDFLLHQVNNKPEQDKRIVLKDISNVYFVKVNEILYCEAEGTYTKFYLVGHDPILVSKNLKEYESMLEPLGFVRTHNSFLANPNKIHMFDKTEGGALILEGGHSIPVSQRKRDSVLAALEGRGH
jgi:two-component system LytT family response regulator